MYVILCVYRGQTRQSRDPVAVIGGEAPFVAIHRSSIPFWFRNEFPVVLVGFLSRHVHHRRRGSRSTEGKNVFTFRFRGYVRLLLSSILCSKQPWIITITFSKTNFDETLILFLLAPIPDDYRPTSFSQGHSLHSVQFDLLIVHESGTGGHVTRDGSRSILLLSLYPSFPLLSSHVSLNIDSPS